MGINEHSALLETYRQTGDYEIRNKIILKHMDLVRYHAMALRNTYAKYAEHDDIINEGVLALMQAVDTFDPTRNAKFETYASLKIRGAIIDFVRKQDILPRQVRKFSKELDQAFSELFSRFERAPTNDELAEYMGIPRDKLEKGMADANAAVTVSFEELLYEDHLELLGTKPDDTDSALYQKELKFLIEKAIEGLKPKEKQVVTLYYFERLKFSEIAQVLGVTESRVSQIHTKAMLWLKHQLEEYIQK